MRPALFALIVLHAMAARAVERVESITLHLTRGPRTCHTTDVVIRRTAGGYTDGTHEFATADVQLVAQLALAPPVKDFDLDSLGFTPERLKAEVQQADISYAAPAAWVREMLRPRHFADVLHGFSAAPVFMHDACPERTELEIRFGSGQRIGVQDGASEVFGLPWAIELDGKEHWQTFDSSLSLAIAGLFATPQSFAGADLKIVLLNAMMSHAAEIDQEEHQYDPFGGRYDIDSELSGALVGLDPHGETGWMALVKLTKDAPIEFALFLSKEGGSYHSSRQFERDASELVRRSSALPFVTPGARVFYQDDAPLTKAAQADIVAAVEKHAPSSAGNVARSIDKAFAVEVSGSRIWVVLPDGSYFRYWGECSPGPACPAIGQIVKP